jgi:hypothetical protein
MVERSARRILGKADARRGVGLGVAINQKRWLLGSSETGGQIHSGRRFAHATLLVSNRDNSCQETPNLQKLTKGAGRCKMFHVEHHFDLVDLAVERPGLDAIVPRGTAYCADPSFDADISI